MTMSVRNGGIDLIRKTNERGFTLVEILIVMSIIGILFVIIVPQVNSYFIKSNETGIRTDFRAFQHSTEMFLRETLGNDISTEKLNKYLDKSNQIVEQDGKTVTTKQDPWGTPYSVHHESVKVTFISHGKNADTSSNVYTITSYIYKNSVDSCTYGFNTGNLTLTKIQNIPDNFVCGDDLVPTSSDPTTGGLNTPTDFKATEVSGKRAVLSWTSVSNSSGYILKRNGAIIYKGTSLSFTDITLDYSKAYTYEIASYNGANTSAYGSITVTTPAPPVPPKQDGTCEFPFIITNVTGLQNMKNNLNTCYVLGNDIDARMTKDWNAGAGFEPVGTSLTPFKGSLDGKGYVIKGLTINRPSTSRTGLFGTFSDGEVKNIEFTEANVIGSSMTGIVIGFAAKNTTLDNIKVGGTVKSTDYVGGIVGSADNSSIITGSWSSADVTGEDNAGGLAGAIEYESTITLSHATGKVTGDYYVGGLVGGVREDSIVSSSTATGSALGRDNVGGLVGILRINSEISSSNSSGNASGEEFVGGLVGKAETKSNISKSTASGDALGETYVGGLVGILRTDSSVSTSSATGDVLEAPSQYAETYLGGLVGGVHSSTIDESFATGRASGYRVGGLVGYAESSIINNTFAKGVVFGYFGGSLIGYAENSTIKDSYGVGFVQQGDGGLMESNANTTATNSYYDTITTKKSNAGKGEGKTTGEMKQKSTYVNWDFDTVWSIVEGADYPKLKRGSGNQNTKEPIPILITTCVELQNMNKSLHATYKLSQDIDCSASSTWLSGKGFTPIGSVNSPFTGTLNGDGHRVKGLTINLPSDNYAGLFSAISGGTVKNIEFTEAQIMSKGYSGIVVGKASNHTLLSNIQVDGLVKGDKNIGGVAGEIENSNIENSYSSVNVTGDNTVGGLVGNISSQSLVSKSNATGVATGTGNVGGLIGSVYSQSTVTKSSFLGNVVSNSNSQVGGLVGSLADSIVEESFADVRLIGPNIGGLVGFVTRATIDNSYAVIPKGRGLANSLNSGSNVKNSYAIGFGEPSGNLVQYITDSTITNSYYDDISTGTNTGRGIAKTTSEMKSNSTYIGWDFSTIWSINPSINNGFPFLRNIQ